MAEIRIFPPLITVAISVRSGTRVLVSPLPCSSAEFSLRSILARSQPNCNTRHYSGPPSPAKSGCAVAAQHSTLARSLASRQRGAPPCAAAPRSLGTQPRRAAT
eukprot:6187463-Pleurochrysis_carterae.AAC.1